MFSKLKANRMACLESLLSQINMIGDKISLSFDVSYISLVVEMQQAVYMGKMMCI